MASLNSHNKELSRIWKGKILWDKPMSQYSTLKVGGPAEALVKVTNLDDLKRLLHWLNGNEIDWWVVGRGSNILVPDNGLTGVIIILEDEFTTIDKLENNTDQDTEKNLIRAGGGCLLTKLVQYCIENSLSGLEFAAGIPGSIGGAIVMNAGAWGVEIGNIVKYVTLMNHHGDVLTEPGENLGFSYRGWGVDSRNILLDATLVLKPGIKEEIKAACKKYHELRKEKQPLSEPSAGSFFKNPPRNSAGRLIDEAGLKGHTIGGAKISEKHANFIVNTGNASAADFINLMRYVQETVFQRFGVNLEPEVHILGNEG